MGGITGSITSAIGDYGLYAVFPLMLVDAVFPAASEVVMVYGGALAAGAFAGSNVTLFGSEIDSTGWGFVAVALGGTAGYLVGSLLGWGVGFYGGGGGLRGGGRRSRPPREGPPGRAVVRVDSGRDPRDAARPLHGADASRLRCVVLRARGRRRGRRRELGALPRALPLRGLRRRCGRGRGGRAPRRARREAAPNG